MFYRIEKSGVILIFIGTVLKKLNRRE